MEAAALVAWLDLNDLIAQGPAPQALQDTLSRVPDDLDARYHLAIWRALGGDPETAMEELLAIMRLDRSFRDDGARKALLRIFDFVGAEHPLVRRMRARLAMLLN
jgi:putative thioredoxin